MPYGTVKWFDEHKGYGIITTEDGREVLVHFSAIKGAGFKTLKTGDRVSFDVIPSPVAPQASNVTRP